MELNFNDCSTWCQAAIYSPPAAVDVKEFQQKINRIMGLSKDRHPIVRLVWAGSKDTFSKFYCEWTEAGFGTKTELRAKYKFAQIRIPGTPDVIDVPPARWILEERIEPEQYYASWEAARWVIKESKRVERRPLPPTDGYYSHLLTIAVHNEHCCSIAKRDKVVCWGQYREPAQFDLDNLKQAKARRDADHFVDPYAPLSDETLDRTDAEVSNRVTELKADRQQKMSDAIDDDPLKFLSYFTGVDFTGKVKPFSLPGPKKKEVLGIDVPKS